MALGEIKNGNNIPTDTELNKPDMPADSKAVGDKIDELNQTCTTLNTSINTIKTDIKSGTLKGPDSIYLKRATDTRSTASKPSDYFNKFILTGIKGAGTLGLPTENCNNGYYTVIGLCGWQDATGPTAIEIAFGYSNIVYIRDNYGSATSWGSWRKYTGTNA